jgi:hypothetical protein
MNRLITNRRLRSTIIVNCYNSRSRFHTLCRNVKVTKPSSVYSPSLPSKMFSTSSLFSTPRTFIPCRVMQIPIVVPRPINFCYFQSNEELTKWQLTIKHYNIIANFVIWIIYHHQNTFSNKYFKMSTIKEVACFRTKQKDWEMDCPRSWVMLETLEMDPIMEM